MKALLLVLGIAALLGGLLFAGQGAGIVQWPAQSFMVDSRQWVTYGLIIAAAGLLLIVIAARRPS
jgi:hypothetical protein